MRENNLIQPGSPYWWSTDYAPDPREYMPFEEFYEKLVDIGEGCKLYSEPRVPMTVLGLTINGQSLNFMVTARPYHEKETRGDQDNTFQIREIVSADNALDHLRKGEIPNHCLPHIRGMFIEAKGTHLFWSILHNGRNEWRDFPDKVKAGLGRAGLTGILVHDFMWYSSFITNGLAYQEAANTGIIHARKPANFSIGYREVSRPEFCDGLEGESNLTVKYPVRIQGFDHTLPVLVANRTLADDATRGPVALGIEALSGTCSQVYGLWPFKNKEIAQEIAQILTREFGMEVDVLLRTSRKGSPLDERISPIRRGLDA